jgi:hypothetical protein
MTCVTELIRLARADQLLSVEAFGHVVDILQHIRNSFGTGGQFMRAEDDQALKAAVQELAVELGVDAQVKQQVQQFRLRPGPKGWPVSTDGISLPANGMLLTIFMNLITKWLSDPAFQAKLLEWIISLFDSDGPTLPANAPE